MNAPALDRDDLAGLNAWLRDRDADTRVDWALRTLPGVHVLSSSFGAQAAASLHLLTQHRPRIPVVLIDTGYLFAETYAFVDRLRERLDLNLRVARPALSPTWLEARHGRLWEQGEAGLDRYNRLAKIEPMQRMLAELDAGTWFAGLRRSQSDSRADTPFVERRNGRWKVHPIADWSDRDVGLYLQRHDLPYHPLWDEGYVSIGDVHTTRRWQPGMREEDTRFFGLKRECGLHLDV
ncbi:phosphoadenylyl-sulfate reductase [Oleiagrimonas soli]|uniref:Phosphoadenosine 5'-phosphosulfate reductase n=1 Tax=Oleiagrimonas soli TaxID=1543381 RepID=A0A099CXG9_9GAMM|nr:phosphoadenylyl-sulfate reductase [Oleiagrimonas soli]KGI78678.1 phosphoadenosine phosphosulfate reductase [Oleiagrimonas soli]MBB6184006.1 phosphoadenosine phosphosulfate reductase [Oleiagrimonas soli]